MPGSAPQIQATSIQRVALLRCGSVTHAWDGDQRYVGLPFVRIGAAPPGGGVAPPGFYTLWIIDDHGRPCRSARFVRVS